MMTRWCHAPALVLALALCSHHGQAAALEIPLGLEAYAVYQPEDNPPTPEKIALGRQLFFDPRLSRDRSISCSTCHDPQLGFADGQALPIGIDGQIGSRHTPTLINRAFSKEQFWDGRAEDLEAQAKGPMTNPLEMGFSIDGAEQRLRQIDGYRRQFFQVFGTEQFTIDHVAQALAAFERTLMSGNSAFDRFTAGDSAAMSGAARRGLSLFKGKAECFRCHVGFTFTDEGYRNIGVAAIGDTVDEGRYAVTLRDQDRGAFKTPTLRDIARTAPYFHDGSAASLEEVVEYYNRGGIDNPNLAAEIRPLDLTDREVADLVEFLRSLNGDVPSDVEAPDLPQ